MRATDRHRSSNEAATSISKRLSMFRKVIVVLATVLVLGSSALSTSAFALSGGHGESARRDSFRGSFAGIPRDSVKGNGTDGLLHGLRGNGNRDVWGHWGTYYGPMISRDLKFLRFVERFPIEPTRGPLAHAVGFVCRCMRPTPRRSWRRKVGCRIDSLRGGQWRPHHHPRRKLWRLSLRASFELNAR